MAWLVAEIPPSVAKASANSAKYSAGPNKSATFTSCGARNTSPQVAKNAPTKDAMPDRASASPARPACAIGYPSRQVIIAGSSPGMFKRIELMRPPYIAP